MKYINLHTHHFTGRHDVFELVNQYPKEFDIAIPHYSIGIHPWHIVEDSMSKDLAILESKLEFENCLAVGECGLDKRIAIPFSLQTQIFEKQLLLAEHYKKPLILHCVAAFQEVIEMKNALKITVPMIVHGFSKNQSTAKQLLDNGFYVSFGKYLLRNPELESVFKSVPNDRFFLETDTIEESIRDVYHLAAQYRNCTVEDLQYHLQQNFNKIFTNNQIIK